MLRPLTTPLQVRCQAYASLAAFPFEVLESIEALRPLGAYAALLHSELRRQPTRGSSGSPLGRRQQQAAAAVLQECEALVQSALAHEHATRRHVAARAGGAREHSHAAAGAAGSGAATMSHRLQSTLPKPLLGGSAASAAELLQRLPDLPAAAVQLFFAPPPPLTTGSKASAAAAAKHAAAEYQAVFQQLLRQAGAVSNAAEDAGEASLSLAAWASFLRRWLAAERAAAKPSAASQQQAATDAAMQVWSAIEAALAGAQGSTPAAAANAVWAAAALCLATQQPLPALVTAVHASLSSIAAGGLQHPAAAQRAALVALGSIAEVVRLTLGAPALEAKLRLLQGHLSSEQPAAGGSSAAAMTGLGLTCAALCGSGDAAISPAATPGGSLPPAVEQLMRPALAAVLSSLCASWPGDASCVSTAATRAGLPVAGLQLAAAGDVLPSAAAALAAALPAVSTLLPAADLLTAVVQQTAAVLQLPAADPPAVAALCGLAGAAAAAGFARGCLDSGAVSSVLAQLLSLTDSHADGRIVGGAAAAAGALLAAALRQGFTPYEQQTASAVSQKLLAVPAAATRLPHAAAAKRGAAAGAAALLQAGTIDPGSQQFKAAGVWAVGGARVGRENKSAATATATAPGMHLNFAHSSNVSHILSLPLLSSCGTGDPCPQ